MFFFLRPRFRFHWLLVLQQVPPRQPANYSAPAGPAERVRRAGGGTCPGYPWRAIKLSSLSLLATLEGLHIIAAGYGVWLLDTGWAAYLNTPANERYWLTDHRPASSPPSAPSAPLCLQAHLHTASPSKSPLALNTDTLTCHHTSALFFFSCLAATLSLAISSSQRTLYFHPSCLTDSFLSFNSYLPIFVDFFKSSIFTHSPTVSSDLVHGTVQ